MSIRNFLLPAFLAVTLAVLTAGCAIPTKDKDAQPPLRGVPMRSSTLITPPAGAQDAADAATIYKGTGQLVKGQLAGGALPAGSPGAVASGPAVSLNFEGADLREVVRNILSDILGESYTIDPQVGGTVTIRTTTGIPREALPATLEMLLRSNGAAMIKEAGIWKVVPAATVLKGNVTPQLGNSTRALPPGYSVQLVPLRYMSARQMADSARAVRARRDQCAGRRPAQHAHPFRNRARAAPPAGDRRHVRRQLDRRNVGRAVHLAKRRRQERDERARQGLRHSRQEPARGSVADHSHRAHERAAGGDAAAGVPRRGQEMDRAAGQGRRRLGRAFLRLSGTKQPRRTHRAVVAAGFFRPGSATGGSRTADTGAGHAGGNDRFSACVPAANLYSTAYPGDPGRRQRGDGGASAGAGRGCRAGGHQR